MKEKNREIREITEERYEDFYKLYKVFESPPYSEKFSDEEIRAEYELLTSHGHVYGYYEDDVCIGMVTYNDKKCYNHPVNYDAVEKVAYLSDVAVLPEYRNMGIGTILMHYVVNCAKQEGYDFIYMRTLQPEQSMSYKIALRVGFILLKATEIVDRERSDENRDTQDVRIFLEKIL